MIKQHWQYFLSLDDDFHRLSRYKVFIPAHGIELAPWQSWQSGESPSWWKAHNAVKHDRSNNYREANLCNALTSVAGLYVLIVKLIRVKYGGEMNGPWSKFFNLEAEHNEGFYIPEGEE